MQAREEKGKTVCSLYQLEAQAETRIIQKVYGTHTRCYFT